jgi:hypothetical protein
MDDGTSLIFMGVMFLLLISFCMGTLIGQPETFEVNEPQHWTITQCMLKNETPQSFDFECFSRYMKDYDKRIYEQDILTCDCSTETPYP